MAGKGHDVSRMNDPRGRYALRIRRRKELQLVSVIENLELTRQHLLIFSCSFLTWCCGGYLVDPIGLIFPYLEAEWGHHSPHAWATSASTATGSIALAAMFAGKLADHIGRRTVARLASVVAVLGLFVSYHAPTLWVMTFGRFITGLGFGANLVAVPALLSECAPKDYPRLLVVYQSGWPLGATVFAYVLQKHSWRSAIATGLPPAIILALLLLFVVESPRSLFARGHEEEAEKELKRLSGDLTVCIDDSTERLIEGDCKMSDASTGAEDDADLRIMLQALFFAQGFASSLIKTWLPRILEDIGLVSPRASNTFTIMWAIEFAGILSLGIIFGGATNKLLEGRRCAEAQLLAEKLLISKGAFLIAMACVIPVMFCKNIVFVGLLGGWHLIAQGAVSNFTFPYAAAAFGTRVRASRISGFMLASQAGAFLGPYAGSSAFNHLSKIRGAEATLCLGACTYAAGSLTVTKIYHKAIKGI